MIKLTKNTVNEIKAGSYIIFKLDYNSYIERIYIVTYICEDYIDRKIIYSNDGQIYNNKIYLTTNDINQYYLLDEKESNYYLKLATFT